jgi:hypothetical protein
LPLLLAPAAHAYKDSVPDWVRTAASQAVPTLPPTTDAVVLLDETTLSIGTDGKASEHHRFAVKILRPTGRDYGRVYLYFDQDTKLSNVKVWSIGPDGHEYQVKDSEMSEIGAGSNGGNLYTDGHFKTATPPGRDPGGIVAYEYDQRLPYYSHEADWDFRDEIPRLKQSYTVDAPPNFTVVGVTAHHEPVKPIDLEHSRYRWEFDNTPAIDIEHTPLAPGMAALEGRLAIHFAQAGDRNLGTWLGVGLLYDQISRDRMAPNPEIAAKAAELVAGKTDFYDKIEAIAEFVQKQIRYFVIEKGIGGLQPHPAADIFHNRYGDCKDKSTLLSAMLSSVGIHSAIVLVDHRRGFVDPNAPSMEGDHAIAAIQIPDGYNSPKLRSVVTLKNGHRYLIADPTWDKTAFGQIEHNLQGGYALLVEGNDSEVVQIPVLSPDLNTLRRTASFQLAPDGSIKGTYSEKRFGDLSETRREMYMNGDAKEQSEFFDRILSRDFTSFNLSDLKTENVQAFNKDLVTTFNLRADKFARTAGPLLMVRPRILGIEGLETDHKPRTVPIDLGQTEKLTDDFTIQIPDGYVADDLPDPIHLDLGFAAYESSTQLTANTLHYTRTYTVRQLTLPASRYPEVIKLAETIAADEQARAVLKKK